MSGRPEDNAALTAIFCDDIRPELGNKMSLMGCYHDELRVATTPILLTRLCAYATLQIPATLRLKSVTFRVVQNGNTELARAEIPRNLISPHTTRPARRSVPRTVSAGLIFVPDTLSHGTTLQVLADIDSETVSGPQLLVHGGAEPEAAAARAHPRRGSQA